MKNLNKTILLGIFFTASFSQLFGQGKIVMKDDVYIVMTTPSNSDSVFIVLDNKDRDALQTNNGGNLVSEGENNKLRWNIKEGAGAGDYVIPFTTSGNVKIPLHVKTNVAGSSDGRIDFSTYSTASNNTPYPTNNPDAGGVTNVNKGGSDNSSFVIDRFWIIDAKTYTTKPDVDLRFDYDPADVTGGIDESRLQAQRYEPSPDDWGEFIDGVAFPTFDSVNAVKVAPADFESVWTLVDNSSPLPVEFLYFTAEWYNEEFESVELDWETASETNNDYFEIQRSTDGVRFERIMDVPTKNPGGNSNHPTNYIAYDEDPYVEGTSYYKILQYDINGALSDSTHIEVLNPENNFDLITLYPNPNNGKFTYVIYSSEAKDINVEVMNNLGQIVLSKKGAVNKGVNTMNLDVQSLAASNYIIRVSTNTDMVHREFVSKKR